MMPALSWDLLEAGGGSKPEIGRRKAGAAAEDVLKDKLRAEAEAVKRIMVRLETLQTSLRQRVLADPGSVTDFRRFVVGELQASVDRMMQQTQAGILEDTKPAIDHMADLGEAHADEPVKAADLRIPIGTVKIGLDRALVDATFDNLAVLLSEPMQQFRNQVVVSIRRVAVAGDNRMQEIHRLRDIISGQGFDNAQFRAERIIRTEMGRVFNETTFARLSTLAQEFPFIRKGWRATRDGRTRPTHIQAGLVYARGGLGIIPIAELFRVGQAKLRFPIDPLAEPAGKVAARETIMCRCNAFVDFDLKAYADHINAKVLGQFKLDEPEPAPPAPPPPVLPGALPKQPKARVPKARPTKVPKVATPKPADVLPSRVVEPAPVPTAAQVQPTPGPVGPKVSAALTDVRTDRKWAPVRKAIELIDKVHGDGRLKPIPLNTKVKKGALGTFGSAISSTRYDAPQYVAVSGGKGLARRPINTTIHEVGHWLDNAAIEPGPTQGSYWASEHRQSAGMKAWAEAVKASKAIQTLRTWAQSHTGGPHARKMAEIGKPLPGVERGTNGVPVDLHGPHINYLLSTRETWARAYAQYIQVRSGDPAALAELRQMQKATLAATTGVEPKARYDFHHTGHGWDYPNVWQDDDFEPIAKAIDQVLLEHGWRK